jgi:zeaxanthin glucosyltransferase
MTIKLLVDLRRQGGSMATIALLIEHEEGHLNPTFKLARRLAARGHHVVYGGFADGERYVRSQGFGFVSVGEELFPKGSLRTQREAHEEGGGEASGPVGLGPLVWGSSAESVARTWYEAVCGKSLDRVMGQERPDLVLVTSFFAALATVVRFRYGAAVGLLTPFLRPYPKLSFAQEITNLAARGLPGSAEFLSLALAADPTLRRLQDLTDRALALRELILCPAELEVPGEGFAHEPEVHYVEPSIDLERRAETPFPWERLDPGRRLLFVSLGSQSYRAGEAQVRDFLTAVARAFDDRPAWQVVISTGGLLDAEAIPPPPGGLVTAWAPQVQLLERAAVMITHGGLGTLKECLYYGVPTVVFAISHDQPDNARRVVHHGLGVAGDLESFSPEEIAARVDAADQPAVRQNVTRMQRVFQQAEEAGAGVRLIEELLAARAGTGRTNHPAATAPGWPAGLRNP